MFFFPDWLQLFPQIEYVRWPHVKDFPMSFMHESGDGPICTKMNWNTSNIVNLHSSWNAIRCALIHIIMSELSHQASIYRGSRCTRAAKRATTAASSKWKMNFRWAQARLRCWLAWTSMRQILARSNIGRRIITWKRSNNTRSNTSGSRNNNQRQHMERMEAARFQVGSAVFSVE